MCSINLTQVEKDRALNYFSSQMKQKELRQKLPIGVITSPSYNWDVYSFYKVKNLKYSKKNNDGSYSIKVNTIFKSNNNKFLNKTILMDFHEDKGYSININQSPNLSAFFITEKITKTDIDKTKQAYKNIMKLNFYVNKNADYLNQYFSGLEHLEKLNYLSNSDIKCERISYFNNETQELFFNNDYVCEIKTIFANNKKQVSLPTKLSKINGKYSFIIGPYNTNYLFSKVDFAVKQINPNSYWFNVAKKQQIKIGMPENYLNLSLGSPLSSHYYNVKGKAVKQYVYGDFGPYVYVENGKVTSWQN